MTLLRVWIFLSTVSIACFGQYLRGVNVSGAEFGETQLPGRIGSSHTYNSIRTFKYFAARSLNLIRLQIRWERLQPTLQGPLDPINLNALKQDIEWAKATGCKVIIDAHNYGRYRINGQPPDFIIGNGLVKAADLADFWVRMSNEFKDEPAVYAYDMMNEPHDMGMGDWKSISQAVVSAIRVNGDGKMLMIPGDSWSNAELWPRLQPVSWISDPMNNFTYEAHMYFDHNYSGSYTWSYDQELAANPDLLNVGAKRVTPFLNWCKNNNVHCYLGEYGIPGQEPRWAAVLQNFFTALDSAGIDGTYWAAGEWWPVNDKLSVQPLNDFTLRKPQETILEQHLAPGSFTTLSSAAAWGYATGPGSLVAGYGMDLAPGTQRADSLPLPTKLLDTQVQLTDVNGTVTLAPLIFVSPGQVNYLVPVDVPVGRVDVKVMNADRVVAGGVLEVEALAPALYSANSSGQGVAAAQILRVKADGSQKVENVAAFDLAQNKFVPVPIDFAGDRLFLLLYGTGLRNAAALNSILMVGGSLLNVSYAGPQNQFPGLDQVNAELPIALAGKGEVIISYRAGARAANPVTLTFR